jgi:hypothetical protein
MRANGVRMLAAWCLGRGCIMYNSSASNKAVYVADFGGTQTEEHEVHLQPEIIGR